MRNLAHQSYILNLQPTFGTQGHLGLGSWQAQCGECQNLASETLVADILYYTPLLYVILYSLITCYIYTLLLYVISYSLILCYITLSYFMLYYILLLYVIMPCCMFSILCPQEGRASLVMFELGRSLNPPKARCVKMQLASYG